MQPTTLPRSVLFSQSNPSPLDELLKPIAELIEDPKDCDLEISRIIERLSYLTTRGPARDGRADLLKSIAVTAMSLFLEEIRHGTTNDDELNWFKLAQAFGVSPREAREMFSRKAL